MSNLEDVLTLLGGSNFRLLEKGDNWEFSQVDFQTPAQLITGYYLDLAYDCTVTNATTENVAIWKRLSNASFYDVIVTPKSKLNENTEEVKKAFNSRSVIKLDELLKKNFLNKYSVRTADRFHDFIAPKIELSDKTITDAITHLTNWLLYREAKKKESPRIAVLSAPGGIGKTTLTTEIAARWLTAQETIPLLITSKQWQHLISEKMTMQDVWDEAIQSTFKNPAGLVGNKKALEVLIRHKLLIPIFDGFDELCLSKAAICSPKDLIDELVSMVGDVDAKILITTRETFWDLSAEGVNQNKIERFKLLGFDTEQRRSYFKKCLSDVGEIDAALRLAKVLGGYEGLPREGTSRDRLDGSPFILQLIVSYTKGSKGLNPEIAFHQADPLDVLLQHICVRENARQGLNFDPLRQMSLFEELFRAYPQSILVKDVHEYLDIYNITDVGIKAKFLDHPLLRKLSGDKDFVEPRYELIRTYFIARFLAKSLQKNLLNNAADKISLRKLMALNKDGKTELLDWVSEQIGRLAEPVRRASVKHAVNIIQEGLDDESAVKNSEARMASSAVFHLVGLLIERPELEKADRTKQTASYLNDADNSAGSAIHFKNIAIQGEVRGFDFSNTCFTNCYFTDIEFVNCQFNNTATFKNCTFEETVDFVNSSGQKDIKMEACVFSEQADILFTKLRHDSLPEETSKRLVIEGLKIFIGKFTGTYGFDEIQYQVRFSGRLGKNPFKEEIFNVLEHDGIIVRHIISNVRDGGVKITSNDEMRKEIRQFLSSGFLGKKLTACIEKIVQKR